MFFKEWTNKGQAEKGKKEIQKKLAGLKGISSIKIIENKTVGGCNYFFEIRINTLKPADLRAEIFKITGECLEIKGEKYYKYPIIVHT